MIAYLCMVGTATFLVEAETPDAAYEQVSTYLSPSPARARHGRVMPPTREEVVVRPLRPEDRQWLEDANAGPEFLRALRKLGA